MTGTELSMDEVFDRAADVIDERGWCQNTFEDERGQVCLAGAVRVALGLSTVLTQQNPSSQVVTNIGLISYLSKSLRGAAAWWNDNVCTDRYQAADALRGAAKQYREESAL